MKLSIVTSLYKSEQYIQEFHQRISRLAEELSGDYEIIFVNDGSPDNSINIALDLHEKNNNIVVINLSRNFGHHRALITGLSQAQGDYIFLIDSDLEEEPELLITFYKKLMEQRCDVVYGVQEKRKGGFVERVGGGLFYYLFRKLTGLDMPENIVTARIMTRRYVNSLLQFKERECFLGGLMHITGYRQIPVTVKKHFRQESAYTLGKRVDLLINAITSFSDLPLRYIFILGMGLSFLSIMTICLLIAEKIFYAQTFPGWVSVIVSIWFFGGLTISLLGVVGIYLGKAFMESKQRPYSIVQEVFRKEGADKGDANLFKMVSAQRKISNIEGTGIQYLPGHEEPFADEVLRHLTTLGDGLNLLELGGGGLRFISAAANLNVVANIAVVDTDYHALDYEKIGKIAAENLVQIRTKCSFHVIDVRLFWDMLSPTPLFEAIVAFRLFHFFDPASFDKSIGDASKRLKSGGILAISGIASVDYNVPGKQNQLYIHSAPIDGNKYYRKLDKNVDAVIKAMREQNLQEDILFFEEDLIDAIAKKYGLTKVSGPIKATRIVSGYILKKA